MYFSKLEIFGDVHRYLESEIIKYKQETENPEKSNIKQWNWEGNKESANSKTITWLTHCWI